MINLYLHPLELQDRKPQFLERDVRWNIISNGSVKGWQGSSTYLLCPLMHHQYLSEISQNCNVLCVIYTIQTINFHNEKDLS